VKKSLATAAVVLIALLGFHFMSSPTRAAAASAAREGQAATPKTGEAAATPAGQADVSPVAQDPAVKKAMADLEKSAAEIDKFVNDQPKDGTSAAEPAVQLSNRLGSRAPRECPAVASLPTAEQAATLVQCTMDYETPQQAKLHQDIAVKLSSPRGPTNSDRWPGIDSRARVVDFAANATVYLCGPILEAVMHNTGTNCDRYQLESAPGICWKTIQGGYRCQINAGLPTNPVRSQAPPTTY
jgi:hypothetical protein